MSAPAVVEQARTWANALVLNESRGPGDMENAMRRIEQRWGVPASVLWSLRYRPPKDVATSIMLTLMAAHEGMCERQKRKFEHELAISKAAGGVPSLLARLAAAMAGQPNEGEG